MSAYNGLSLDVQNESLVHYELERTRKPPKNTNMIVEIKIIFQKNNSTYIYAVQVPMMLT